MGQPEALEAFFQKTEFAQPNSSTLPYVVFMSVVYRIYVSFVKQRLRDMQNKLIVIVGDGHDICDWMLCFAVQKFRKINLELKNERRAFL